MLLCCSAAKSLLECGVGAASGWFRSNRGVATVFGSLTGGASEGTQYNIESSGISHWEQGSGCRVLFMAELAWDGHFIFLCSLRS